MTLYMRVTNDIYELPLGVGDSAADLARLLGLKPHTVYVAMSEQKTKPNRKRKSKFIKVEVTENDD